MLTYQGMKPMVSRLEKDAAWSGANRDVRVIPIKFDASASETKELQIKFSDYRSVGGAQLPYKWMQSGGGQVYQMIDVVIYEINAANIADKLNRMPQRVLMGTEKKQ
jgi:hypothetical protein